MQHRKSVALLIETSNAYARGLLDGIIAYQREHELWSIYVGEQQRAARPPVWLNQWQGDGVIARIETQAMATALRGVRLPVVDVSAARLIKELPWVETNDEEIARMAAHHFVERGFNQLAYCGVPHYNWSRWRRKAFVEFAQARNCQSHVFAARSRRGRNYSWTAERNRLEAWVRDLPKPIGLLACYDFLGQQVLDACRELEIAVPEQVAVVGVDNDVRLCRLCTPPLSSVAPDTHRTGYQAAQLLDQMMHGKRVAGDALLIPPLRIAVRQSSDVYAIDDPDVAAALRFIREQACRGISVADVLQAVPVSRRALEHRFQKLIGRTPHAEIVRIRLQRARSLLRETDLSVAEIAARIGYATPEYFSVAFKKQFGGSPRAFQKRAAAAQLAAFSVD